MKNGNFFSLCHPTLTVLCIISCTICTTVMIWGVYAMRADMLKMESMMNMGVSNTSSTSTDMSSQMREHCKMMPEMAGCEAYR